MYMQQTVNGTDNWLPSYISCTSLWTNFEICFLTGWATESTILKTRTIRKPVTLCTASSSVSCWRCTYDVTWGWTDICKFAASRAEQRNQQSWKSTRYASKPVALFILLVQAWVGFSRMYTICKPIARSSSVCCWCTCNEPWAKQTSIHRVRTPATDLWTNYIIRFHTS